MLKRKLNNSPSYKTSEEQGKLTYKVEGMDCDSCAKMIELDLEDAGINASCSFAKQTLVINDKNANAKKIKEIVEKGGYKII